MRFAIHLLGTEVLALEFGTPAADEDDDESPGSFTSYPVGFTRDPAPQWDAPGSYHQFDPDETSEDC